jgi:DNA-binding XRE family transcriptional regulator
MSHTHTPHGLKQYRRLADLTQVQLAEQIGVTRQVVADYESGRTIPRLHIARRLAAVLNCDVDSLFPISDEDGRRAS